MKKVSVLLRLIAYTAIVVIFVLCCFTLTKTDNIKGSDEPMIIELWQLDMVEGGLGSRKAFFDKLARKFEKSNKSVLISVVNETASSAEAKFANGIFPDIISYSTGLEGFLERTKTISKISELDCSFNKKTFAVAWAYGGYCYIVRKGEDISKNSKCFVGQSEYSLPLAGYYLSDYRFSEIIVKTPKLAYQEFLNQKNTVLLGTQRDLFRLNSRNFDYDCFAIENYSDVIQYVSVLSDNENKLNKSKDFINYLMRDGQALVSDIGLMPAAGEVDGNSIINNLTRATSFSTVSVFLGKQDIKNAQSFLISNTVNDKEKIIYIKNLFK